MTGGISEAYGSLDGVGLAALVKSGEVSPSEVLEEAIRRAEAVNGTLNFLTYKAYEEGREMAADPALPDGPFKGVPWLVKEIATDWTGLQNTNACPYFKDIVSTSDNEQVKRVKKAGFVLLGKSNSPEAGWALSTEPKMYGPTVNPWDTTRTPGGSSGGSAAAVAARVLPLAEASDGGGSIRTPACHSGLVGLKPARGRITMAPGADFWYGGVTFLCVSRSVRDTAAFFDTVGGPLPGDPYYAVMPETPYLDEIGKDPGSLSIAMVTASPEGCTPVDAEVREGIENTGKLLESLGHRVTPETAPYDFWPLYDCYMRIGAVVTAAWFDGSAELVGHTAQAGRDREPLLDDDPAGPRHLGGRSPQRRRAASRHVPRHRGPHGRLRRLALPRGADGAAQDRLLRHVARLRRLQREHHGAGLRLHPALQRHRASRHLAAAALDGGRPAGGLPAGRARSRRGAAVPPRRPARTGAALGGSRAPGQRRRVTAPFE